MKILFMCVANSARSQLAEGLAKEVFGNRAEVESAGSMPTIPNPLAVKALAEVGIDISQSTSKSVADLSPDFLSDLDFVITLCAEEVCPVLPSQTAQKLHWPYPDPVTNAGTDEEKMKLFRETREALREKIKSFATTLDLAVFKEKK